MLSSNTLGSQILFHNDISVKLIQKAKEVSSYKDLRLI